MCSTPSRPIIPRRTRSRPRRIRFFLAPLVFAMAMVALMTGLATPAAAQVSVMPSYDAIGSTGPNPYTFTIENDGSRSTTALLQVSCTGAVTSCSASASSVFVGGNGGQATVTVSYATSGSGTGSFTLTATDRFTQQAAQGTVNVTMPSAQPSVTVNPTTVYTAENVSTSDPSFTITNNGNTAAQYTLTASCGGNISACSVSSPTATVAAHGSTAATVNFTTGPATSGNGTLSLTATGPASMGSQASTSPTVTIVPLSETVQVTPDGATAALTVNGSTTVPFTVRETGNAGSGFTYTLTASCSGSIVGCTFTSTGTNTMTLPPGPGVDQTVQVTLTGTSDLAGGYGAVSVVASTTNSWGQTYHDEGSYGTTIPDARTYTVGVSPGSSTSYAEANVPTSVTFTLTNSGNAQATYTVTAPTCSGTAGGCSFSASGSVSSTTVTVNPNGGTAAVSVYVTTGNVGQNASITLHAAGASNAADGTITLVPQAPTVQVTGGYVYTSPTNSSGSVQFFVQNTGSAGPVTYNLQVTGCAPLMTCSVQDTVTVPQGSNAAVQVNYQTLGTGGVDTLSLTATAPRPPFVNLYQSTATGVVTVTSRLAVAGPFMNNTDQNAALCAVSCFAVTAARSTVPYYSLNQPRSVTLAYTSDRAFPRPFVYADVSVASAPDAITEYRLEVQRNGVDLPFTNGETVLHFQGPTTPATTYRLAGQLDLSSDSTGMVPVTVLVTAVYANGTTDQMKLPTQLMVVNTSHSPVARGWTVAGVPRLYVQPDSSVLMVDGSGSGEYFERRTSDGYTQYLTPASEYNATLTARPYGAGWVHTALDSTRIWFSAAGLADSVTDRFGISTRFQYDGSQRLVRIVDSTLVRSVGATRAATMLYYGAIGLDSIVEAHPVAAAGRTTAIHVDANGLLRAIVDPDADSTSYSYDLQNRLSSIRDRNGTTMTYAYDATWKAASISAPAVPTDAGRGTTTLQTPVTHLDAWQKIGVPMNVTSSTPAPLLKPDTLAARVTDPFGHVTSITPDPWGQPLKITDPLGDSTIITRANGQPLATHVLYPDATTDEYVYYPAPLVSSTIHNGRDTVYYAYGDAGQLRSVHGSGVVGETRTLEPETGRVVTVQYGSNPADTTHYAYDPVTQQVASVRTPDGATTTYQYDPVFGNLAVTTAPGHRVTAVVVDAYGRDSAVTAPQTPTQRTVYDVVNRPTDLYDGMSSVPVHLGYAGDLVVSVRDQHGQVDSTEYDALGRAVRHFALTSSTLPTTTRYDLDSRPTSTTNRRGQRIDLTYDALDRVLTKRGDNTTSDRFAYSASRAVETDTAMSAGDTVIVRSVPRALTAASVTTIGGHTYTVTDTLTSQADGTDRTTITSDVPGLSFLDRRYAHDAVTGGLHAITLGTAATTFGYNDAAERNTTTWPSGVTGGATYLSIGGYASQRYGALTSAIDRAFSADYVADSAGRLLRDHRTNAVGTAEVNRVFGYDALGQFTGVTDASARSWNCGGSGRFDPDYGDVGCAMDTVTVTRSYAYDLVGNRSTTFLSGTQYTGDRLVQLPDVVNGRGTYYQYTYDDDGNVRTKTKTATGETWTYAWSAENHLTSVTHAVSGVADSTVTFSYDAFGQPVKKTRGSTLERLSLYDGGQLLADLAADGTRLAEYVYDAGTDTPHAVLGGAIVVTDTEYVAQDGLGNVTGTFTTNASGTTVQQRVTYGDWGAPSVTGTSPNRLFWKGLAYDADAGLYSMRARWYDPDAGRFVSEDPAGLQGGINPYVFAGNDPVNGADPTGLTACATVTDGPTTVDGVPSGVDNSETQCFGQPGGSELPRQTWPADPDPGPIPSQTGGGKNTSRPPLSQRMLHNPACRNAVASAAFSVALDLLAADEIKIAYKAGGAAARYGAELFVRSTGQDFARTLGVGLSKNAYSAYALGATAIINRNLGVAGFMVTSSMGPAPVVNEVTSDAPFSPWDLLDYIPVVGSGKGIWDAVKACK